MCLALPARVVQLLTGDEAVIELGGVRKTISLALVENVAVDDYVIVHTGYALSRLDPDEAATTMALIRDAQSPAGAVGP